MKPYGGTQELVNGDRRFCIWVEDTDVDEALEIPALKARIDDCREYRSSAGRDAKKAAKKPHAFCYSTYQNLPFIRVGNTIGADVAFVPATLTEPGTVISHAAFAIYGLKLIELSIVLSTLHRVWAETVSGKLGNGIRYGNTVVYNTFPVPTLTEKNKADLTRCAEDILLAREAHFPATIADLYEVKDGVSKMPADLREAHERNDEVLERIYIGRRFKNDTERLEKLFDLYARMIAAAGKAPKAKRGKAS